MKEKISFEYARVLANNSAKEIIDGLPSVNAGCVNDYLDDHYLEAKGCWFFYRKKEIVFPLEASLSNYAYAITRFGETFFIPDYRESPQKEKEYLAFFSESVIKKGI